MVFLPVRHYLTKGRRLNEYTYQLMEQLCRFTDGKIASYLEFIDGLEFPGHYTELQGPRYDSFVSNYALTQRRSLRCSQPGLPLILKIEGKFG